LTGTVGGGWQLKKGRADRGNDAVPDADDAACGCKYPGSKRFGTIRKFRRYIKGI